MLVEFGNASPHEALPDGSIKPVERDGAHVVYQHISDARDEAGEYLTSKYALGTDGNAVRDHLFFNPGMVQHLPDCPLLVSSVRGFQETSREPPTWVAVDAQERDPAFAQDFERALSEVFQCARGKPADVEDTHWTEHRLDGRGMFLFPPGVSPENFTQEPPQ